MVFLFQFPDQLRQPKIFLTQDTIAPLRPRHAGSVGIPGGCCRRRHKAVPLGMSCQDCEGGLPFQVGMNEVNAHPTVRPLFDTLDLAKQRGVPAGGQFEHHLDERSEIEQRFSLDIDPIAGNVPNPCGKAVSLAIQLSPQADFGPRLGTNPEIAREPFDLSSRPFLFSGLVR